MDETTFDFIVVGSGSAGATLAARLSEDKAVRVLCLEAGTRGQLYLWTLPPAGTAFMFDNPEVNWRFFSEPDPSYGDRALYVPEGKIVGGSSAINGMIYNRGQALDYDTWAQLGCRGWSYEDVLPIFKRIESCDIGSDDFRGRNGPIKITVADKTTPFFDLFIRSAEAVGIPFNPDYSGATQEGVAMAQQTISRGIRQSVATRYLGEALRRPNLSLKRAAVAVGLDFEGRRCVGVRYRQNGVLHVARAGAEVIVSGGSINSPKLLELSGIGAAGVLEPHGITVQHELPGVGANLRDHYAPPMEFMFNRSGLSLCKSGRGFGLAREMARYALLRKGFISQAIGTMRVFARTRPDLETPDIMMVVAPFLTQIENGVRRVSPRNGFAIFPHVQRPESVGEVHIRSADPDEPPRIRFKFLDTPTDRQAAIGAIRMARRIVASKPLADVIESEVVPGPSADSDQALLDHLRSKGRTTYHPIGTCRMGHDPMAVTDDQLRVHGLEGLRVADASIMPTLVSGNTNIPAIMIGEKCADMILGQQRGASMSSTPGR